MISQLVSEDERIQIGIGTYASSEPLIRLHHPNNKVLIGKFCSLANSVTIFSGGNHPIDFISTHPLKLFFGVGDYVNWSDDCSDGNKITRIGNDVWLGHGCTILSGATVGDGAIIGAQAVVRGKIPPYAIVIGNPATIVRYRYDEQTINQLRKLKWWDWPTEKIICELPNLSSSNITSFLSRHCAANPDPESIKWLNMPFTSYAQNFEDVMLWRALKHIEKGCYIDVGAQHPVIDSVSKAFYERGWRGVHVEPVLQYANLLREDRPEETVLQVALSDTEGTLELNLIPETGLSTGVENHAKRHQTERGLSFQKITVPMTTLKSALIEFAGKDVHWLKIDVEGLETQVLKGWDSQALRPWIMVLEATIPNSSETDYASWEPILTAANYTFVYFDGLNRFYVAQEHAELAAAFFSPPNVFDDVLLTEYSPICREIVVAHRAKESEFVANATRQEELAANLEARRVHAEAWATQAEQRAAQAEQRAAQAEQRAAQAEQRAAQAEQRAAQAEQRAAQAEQRAAQAEQRAVQAEHQLSSILGSRSWLITRPLRWLTRQIQTRSLD